MSIRADAAIAAASLTGYAAQQQDVHVWALAGACAGGLLAASVMDGAWLARLTRWFASLIAGVLLTPAVIATWLPSAAQDAPVAMSLAGGLAFASWGVLRAVQDGSPAVGKAIAGGFKRLAERLFGP